MDFSRSNKLYTEMTNCITPLRLSFSMFSESIMLKNENFTVVSHDRQ